MDPYRGVGSLLAVLPFGSQLHLYTSSGPSCLLFLLSITFSRTLQGPAGLLSITFSLTLQGPAGLRWSSFPFLFMHSFVPPFHLFLLCLLSLLYITFSHALQGLPGLRKYFSFSSFRHTVLVTHKRRM